ncbi:uncharacterized protein LOC119663722 [Teleopsis dalmanni]|uniref:uncharacterized protein LOC119663722 n=1 Tax=Teleopsis dalmanni TaxID=139649 RepID=UPI0018CD10D4|nr:uncharacterized protein LOC119663722 [Teleopsis dalmanni]
MNEGEAVSATTSTTVQHGTTPAEICRIGVQPPVFCKRDPDLYFLQMEAQFRNARITQDQTKYDYVIGSLDGSTLRKVADIVRSPPSQNKYDAIRNRLIQNFADSENKKLRRLILDCELHDNKPSQLLRTMRDLAAGAMNDGALKQFWLDRLPVAVRAVVSIADGDLDKCALQADKMIEMGSYGSGATVDGAKNSQSAQSSSIEEMQTIKNAVLQLSKDVAEIKQRQYSNRRPRFRTPDRDPVQHIRTRSANQVWCQCNQMYQALQIQGNGKLKTALSETVDEASGYKSSRLFIVDKKTQHKFLVNTGADFSVFPITAIANPKSKPTTSTLFAANGSHIKTYGSKLLTLNLGLRKSFAWYFTIVDVSKPILGADFLKNFNLLVDVANKRIIDNQTKLQTLCIAEIAAYSPVSSVNSDNKYQKLLAKFKDLTSPLTFNSLNTTKTTVQHHIYTSGRPVFSRARRLNPSMLQIARQEFEYMLSHGICTHSKSDWASPLNMVSKKNGTWRPCGDYRQLNSQTLPDRYPIPHIQDFAQTFNGKSIYTTIDIEKAYFNIPIAAEDKKDSDHHAIWSF